MQLVLQAVLDLTLERAWNVVSMGDVPDPCEGHGCRELICEAREVTFDAPEDEAIRLT